VGKTFFNATQKEYNKKWVALFFTYKKKGLDHSQKTKKQKRQAQWTIHERLPSS